MRIVHAITRGDVGGAQTQVVELATAQVAAGEEVTIVAGCDGPAMARARRAGAAVVVVPALAAARASGSLRDAYRGLAAAVRTVDPEIVHGHSSHAGLLARIVARREGVASVYTAHGWPFQRGAPWTQRLPSYVGELVGGRFGDAVICLTPAEAAAARGVVPSDRIAVVPNGIADVPSELRRHPTSAGTTVRLVMVARFAPPKQQLELVEALSVHADLPWELSFVGDGPERERCAAASTRLLGERVRYLGEREDVAAVLAASDVAVLWSRYEGMPIALMEAMRAGLCCVASDLPGVRELFGTPPAGLVAADGAALARTVADLVAERGRIDRFGELARHRYEAAFGAEAMMAATREVYATARRRAARRRRTAR